jgi:hypothetical protein
MAWACSWGGLEVFTFENVNDISATAAPTSTIDNKTSFFIVWIFFDDDKNKHY